MRSKVAERLMKNIPLETRIRVGIHASLMDLYSQDYDWGDISKEQHNRQVDAISERADGISGMITPDVIRIVKDHLKEKIDQM